VEHEHVIGTGWRCQGVILRTKKSYEKNPGDSRVADLHHFNADPDPAFYFNADLDLDPGPDPALYFDADPDPAPL
jgi:hypothetical protein